MKFVHLHIIVSGGGPIARILLINKESKPTVMLAVYPGNAIKTKKYLFRCHLEARLSTTRILYLLKPQNVGIKGFQQSLTTEFFSMILLRIKLLNVALVKHYPMSEVQE